MEIGIYARDKLPGKRTRSLFFHGNSGIEKYLEYQSYYNTLVAYVFIAIVQHITA
jgi:hypothetical protein